MIRRLLLFLLLASPCFAAAPTLISYTETTWNAAGATKTTASISWLAGDVISTIQGSEGTNSFALGLPTATGLTFAQQKANNPGSGTTTSGSLVACVVAAGSGSSTVSATATGTNAGTLFWGLGVWVWRGSAGCGNSSEQHTSTKTVSLTPTAADGAIVWGAFDFAATAITGISITPTPTNTRQKVAISTNYTIYVSDLIDQVSAGGVSYGISGGSGTGPFSIVVLEIKAGASSGPNVGFKGKVGLIGKVGIL